VTTLARAEGVRPQPMSATVSALESAGLVGGSPDPGDGRQTILSLTDTCQEWLKAGRAAKEDWLPRHPNQTRTRRTRRTCACSGTAHAPRLKDNHHGIHRN
jgi:DNA-binding MarR family transcriptional regulator